MALPTMAVIAVIAGATALHVSRGASWWYAILLQMTLVLAFQGYRILVYQRFLNPLCRLPGPKVPHVIALLTVGALVLGRVH